MQTCALIPFKNFAHCKQRLRSVLTEEERCLLVAAMLEDTLRAVTDSRLLNERFLLSDDRDARQIALDMGWQCLGESSGVSGLNNSVQAAVAELAEHYDAALVIHGDLPVLSSDEVDAIVSQHARQTISTKPSLTLVPDAQKTGSNCLMVSPPNAISFQYGQGSYEKHLAFAEQRGIQFSTLSLPGAALDIDEAEDLQCLKRSERLCADSATAAALAQIGEKESCE